MERTRGGTTAPRYSEEIMTRYRALKKIDLFSGILELTRKQAEPRAHQLQDLGEGLYEITGHVQFKAGEKFGYDGEVTKAMAQHLEAQSVKKKG